MIIKNALPNLPSWQIGAIQLGSSLVDSLPAGQLEINAYQHAMVRGRKVLEFGGGKEGYAKAREWAKSEMNKFIQGKITEAKLDVARAREYYARGVTNRGISAGDAMMKQALIAFGEAIHPVMDKHSPKHTDWQVYSTAE